MTFEDFIVRQGGPAKVAKMAKAHRRSVSRTHLHNIIAGRKRVTANLVKKLRPLFPKVSAKVWLEWLTESTTKQQHASEARA